MTSALPQALLRKDIKTDTLPPCLKNGNFLQLIQYTFPALSIICAAVTYISCTLFFSTLVKQNTNLKICLQWWIEMSSLFKQMTAAEECVLWLHILQQTHPGEPAGLCLVHLPAVSNTPLLISNITVAPCAAPTQAPSPPEDVRTNRTSQDSNQFLF